MSRGRRATSADDLADLFHHRWAVPILAEVRGLPAAGRVAALARRLGAGRDVLRRTLTTLEELGLARKNPGYGHPLRPEFLLTARGREVGDWCDAFLGRVRRDGFEEVALRKWSMPVLLAVHRGATRFSELETGLAGITARALALSLKELGGAGLVDRVVVDAHPPRVAYAVSRRARRTARLLDAAP